MCRRAVLFFGMGVLPDFTRTGVCSYDQYGKASHQQEQSVPARGKGPLRHQPQPHQLLHRRHHPESPPLGGEGCRQGAGGCLSAQHHRGHRALSGRHAGHRHLSGQRADQRRLCQHECPPDHLRHHPRVHQRQPDHPPRQPRPDGQGQARPYPVGFHHHRLHRAGGHRGGQLLRRHRGGPVGYLRHHQRVSGHPGHLHL